MFSILHWGIIILGALQNPAIKHAMHERHFPQMTREIEARINFDRDHLFSFHFVLEYLYTLDLHFLNIFVHC